MESLTDPVIWTRAAAWTSGGVLVFLMMVMIRRHLMGPRSAVEKVIVVVVAIGLLIFTASVFAGQLLRAQPSSSPPDWALLVVLADQFSTALLLYGLFPLIVLALVVAFLHAPRTYLWWALLGWLGVAIGTIVMLGRRPFQPPAR